MTRRRFWIRVAVLGVVGTAAATLPRLLQDEQFPHERHAGLFPVCAGCHVGVEENDSARFYPAEVTCTGCHDGVVEQRVAYEQPRSGGPSMLDLDHVEHAVESEEGLACEDCHTRAGDTRMQVRYASARRCLACHEHAAPEHIVVADCVRCHVPFAESGLEPTLALSLPVPDTHRDPDFLLEIHGDSARARPERCATCHVQERCTACHVDARQPVIAAIPALGTALVGMPGAPAEFPVPPSHAHPDFLSALHGDSARARPAACSTCHVRERCLSCHVDAQQPVIAAMPSLGASRVALPERPATYPEPPSHRDPDWLAEHGVAASAMPANCATCHTRQSCETCHRGGHGNAVLASLPDARTSFAPGVTMERTAPESHRTPEFRRRHGAAAAASAATCMTCHVRVECEACHFAPDRAPFHPANFESRHPAAAYARELECSSCHSTERFCRDCHTQLGMEAQGRLNPGFHDAQPLWLLRHGQAARQTLESCTSCHVQRDCMQCHSQAGSFQVSPHGPDFEAERARDRNSRICAACHFSDPLGDT